jgi:Uma2 family endonuclease
VSAELEVRLDPQHCTTADLVIEVVSPGSAIYDRNTKADTYGALGVGELWLIDEALQSAEVRNQSESSHGFGVGRTFTKDEVIVSAVLPELVLPVARLFAA